MSSRTAVFLLAIGALLSRRLRVAAVRTVVISADAAYPEGPVVVDGSSTTPRWELTG
jgi:hypothetical protein